MRNTLGRMSLATRLLTRYKVNPETDCWEWTGYLTTQNGYGRLRVGYNKPRVLAHRVSWELHNNRTVPAGLMVLHHCDNPKCINPDHLWLGTALDNSRDRDKKGRRKEPFYHRGITHPQNKYCPDLILEIRKLYTEKVSQGKIGLKFGIPRSTIQAIVLRRTWRHI